MEANITRTANNNTDSVNADQTLLILEKFMNAIQGEVNRVNEKYNYNLDVEKLALKFMHYGYALEKAPSVFTKIKRSDLTNPQR
jgi:hypothetical protein